MKNTNVVVTKTEITINSKPPRSKNAKAVYNVTTGDYYASTIDAGEKIGITQCSISMCCTGKSKTANKQKVIYVSDMPSHLEDISKAMKTAIKEKEDCLAILESNETRNAMRIAELNDLIRAREAAHESEIARLRHTIEEQEAELANALQKLEKIKYVFNAFSELKSEL